MIVERARSRFKCARSLWLWVLGPTMLDQGFAWDIDLNLIMVASTTEMSFNKKTVIYWKTVDDGKTRALGQNL